MPCRPKVSRSCVTITNESSSALGGPEALITVEAPTPTPGRARFWSRRRQECPHNAQGGTRVPRQANKKPAVTGGFLSSGGPVRPSERRSHRPALSLGGLDEHISLALFAHATVPWSGSGGASALPCFDSLPHLGRPIRIRGGAPCVRSFVRCSAHSRGSPTCLTRPFGGREPFEHGPHILLDQLHELLRRC